MDAACRFLATVLAATAIATTVNAAEPSSRSIVGHYRAVVESEWNVELELADGGVATYTFSSWEVGQSATKTTRRLVEARWELKGTTIAVTLPDSTPGKEVAYELSACVSYMTFGGNGCSPGLTPKSSGMGREYRESLWDVRSFKYP